MKILVCGDEIGDKYFHCQATRLCPEAPCPVLHIEREVSRPGGAALVGACLQSLGDNEIIPLYGSYGTKHRIFADRTLLCRIDRDAQHIVPRETYRSALEKEVGRVDAIVVGDYGKGAMDDEIASFLVSQNKYLFVDSKHHAEWYEGCFAIFPNQHEHPNLDESKYQHVIRKLGSLGCSVNDRLVPTEIRQVYDVTGAGDVFLAAFVWDWSKSKSLWHAAEVANKAAGISVEHLGTYVVQPQELM